MDTHGVCCSREAVDSLFLEVFKARLEKPVLVEGVPAVAGGIKMAFKVQPKPLWDSMIPQV